MLAVARVMIQTTKDTKYTKNKNTNEHFVCFAPFVVDLVVE